MVTRRRTLIMFVAALATFAASLSLAQTSGPVVPVITPPTRCVYQQRPMSCEEAYRRLDADYRVEMANAATFRQVSKDSLYETESRLGQANETLSQALEKERVDHSTTKVKLAAAEAKLKAAEPAEGPNP